MRARIFNFCSHLFITVYGRFPIFGALRSSIGIIERDGRFLFQQRNDGLGWAFPGGVSFFWESEAATLQRELKEETGLRLVSWREAFRYHDCQFIPSDVTVFQVETAGDARGSWEGDVRWLTLPEARSNLFPAQQTIAAWLDARL